MSFNEKAIIFFGYLVEHLLDFICVMMNAYINIKYNIIFFYNLITGNDKNYIKNAYLYFNLNDYINVYKEVKYLEDKIDDKFINYLINKYIDKTKYDINDDNIRLKLIYNYNNNEYITYFQPKDKNHIYNFLYNKISNSDVYYIPLPLCSKEIVDNYRSNIVKPYFNKNKDIYNLFYISCKNIQYIKINGHDMTSKLIDYLNKINSPFKDCGLLYLCPIKVKWLLHENNINIDLINNFKDIEIKYINFYLDETNCELIQNKVKLNNLDDYIFTKIVFDKLFN